MSGGGEVKISDWLRAIIRCPACHGELVDAADSSGEPTLVCAVCQLAYPVRDGIPVLLARAAAPRP